MGPLQLRFDLEKEKSVTEIHLLKLCHHGTCYCGRKKLVQFLPFQENETQYNQFFVTNFVPDSALQANDCIT